jgi:hypothetical protein
MSMNPEPEPIEVNFKKVYLFKPNDGEHYGSFHYPMLNGANIILNNVRMCPMCYHRYQDMEDSLQENDETALAMSDSDAKSIVTKLFTRKMER